MPASIRSTLHSSPGGPVVGSVLTDQSRDDLRTGYQVVLESVNTASTYSWSLSFKPRSPGPASASTADFSGTDSTAALLPPENSTSKTAKFNVDWEGSYLVRLVVDAGLPTEDTQYVRMRFLTRFADLKLVSAGERRDGNGVVPVDTSPEGWANDQNQNLQRISVLLRRVSTSGRVLYVDSNRGRDSADAQNDIANIIRFPGPDTSFPDESGIRTQAEAFADFSSINSAIAYAEAAASRGEAAPGFADPYFIVIRPGYYNEDLALKSHIHLINLESIPRVTALLSGMTTLIIQHRPVVVRTANSGGATHSYTPTGGPATDLCVLQGLYLENTSNTATAVIHQDDGFLVLQECTVHQRGNGVTQGPALEVLTADVSKAPAVMGVDCFFRSEATADNERYAIIVDAPSANVSLERCDIAGTAGVEFNRNLYGGAPNFYNTWLVLRETLVTATTGFAYRGYGSAQSFLRCMLNASVATQTLSVDPFGAGAGSMGGLCALDLRGSEVGGDVSFDTRGAVGATSFTLNSAQIFGDITLPGAPGDLPDSFISNIHGRSLGYLDQYVRPESGPAGSPTIPVLNRTGTNNVQDTLDTMVGALFAVSGSPFYSLTSVYNGLASINPLVYGAGLGRTILADDGAVQITGATPPLHLDGGSLDGGLQVEGLIDVGPLVAGGGSEISVNPNPFGAGPRIELGNAVWPLDAPDPTHRGITSAVLQARSFSLGAPVANGNYNMRLRTSDAQEGSTSELGRVVVEGGSVTDGGTGAANAGAVYIQGGEHRESAGVGGGGHIWVVPGTSDNAVVDAHLRVANPSAGTPATLTAAGAIVGAIGVTGSLLLATPDGLITIALDTADLIANVITKINAEGHLIATDSGGGVLQLTTRQVGPNADVLYVADVVPAGSPNDLNAALGDLRVNSGAAYVAGTYPGFVGISCPLNGRLQIHGDVVANNFFGASSFGTYVNVTNAASPHAVAAGEGIIGTNTTGGAVTVNLPTGAAAPAGRVIMVSAEVGATDTTINATGGDAIQGLRRGLSGPSITLEEPQKLLFYRDSGTTWWVFSFFTPPEEGNYDNISVSTGYDQTSPVAIIGVDTAAAVGAVTITLNADLAQGRRFSVKDEGNNAAVNNILISIGGGGTIEGVNPWTLNVNREGIRIYKGVGNAWHID